MVIDVAIPFMLLCMLGGVASLAVSQWIRNRYLVDNSLVPLGIFGLFMWIAYTFIS